MFKYDIPYAKEGQMTLTLNGLPINVSKKKSYLIDKLYAHRASLFENETSYPAATYEIIGLDGRLIFQKTFKEGEKAFTKEPYHKIAKTSVNFICKNGFNLIADEDGNILTDETLLSILYDYIFINGLPITNSKQASVQLATYKPFSKEEFVQLKGLGEKTYNKCGEHLLNVIKVYLSKEKRTLT